MKVFWSVWIVLMLSAVVTSAALAAPTSKHGASGGGTVATKESGKIGKQEPGGGKGSASINGTGIRGNSSSVNGTGMGAQH